jgi:Uma2 family endonuclease
MAYIRRDTQRHTYGDYLTWSAEYGNELIDGVAYVREPPAPSYNHQGMVGELFHQIRVALDSTPYSVCMAPLDVRLPKSDEPNDQIDTVVQPDVLIVCDPGKIDARGIRGAPDWVAEVLSPSTASYDRKRKIPVYERAGVREVWLIGPTDRKLTIYRLEQGRFGDPIKLNLSGETEIEAAPGVRVNWDRLLARLLPGGS